MRGCGESHYEMIKSIHQGVNLALVMHTTILGGSLCAEAGSQPPVFEGLVRSGNPVAVNIPAPSESWRHCILATIQEPSGCIAVSPRISASRRFARRRAGCPAPRELSTGSRTARIRPLWRGLALAPPTAAIEVQSPEIWPDGFETGRSVGSTR